MSIHPSAYVHPDARIDPSVNIGAHAVVEAGVEIGPGCEIAHSVILLGRTTIGAGCRIHSHAVLGDVPQDRAFEAEQTSCQIGRDCVIREGVTIHRGTGADAVTKIGDRCYLMTNSHVAHNCVLADDVTLVSGALLGGYVHVGQRAIISGNAAIHQFVRIGELAIISGVAIIVQDIPPFLMTGRDGAIAGLNSVGMLRAGFTAVVRQEIKLLYKMMYRSQLSRSEALLAMRSLVQTEQGHCFIDFITSESSRGIRKAERRR